MLLRLEKFKLSVCINNHAIQSRASGGYLDTNMLDSAVYYVENDNSLNASCLLLPLALKSDTNKVKQHIAIIQDEANHLSSLGQQVESDELNRFCNFYSFLMKIANRNGGYYSITDQEKQILQNFASTPSVVSSNARAILEFISNDVPYIDAEPYLQLNAYQIEEEITPNGPLNSNGKLNAYPNPFSGQFFVEGELDGDPINATLKIMDASGRLLYSQEISNSNFNLSIDMSSYDAGLYLIGVINNSELVAVKRIIQK